MIKFNDLFNVANLDVDLSNLRDLDEELYKDLFWEIYSKIDLV